MTYDEYMQNTGSVTPIVDVSTATRIWTQEDEQKYAEEYPYAHMNPTHIQLDLETVQTELNNNEWFPKTTKVTKHQMLTGEPYHKRPLEDKRDSSGGGGGGGGSEPTWEIID